MPIVPAKDRKNAFSPRLKDKREKLSDEKAEMTPDEIRVFESFVREASTWIGNVHCSILEPSPEQAKHMDDTLRELVERIEEIRSRLVASYARWLKLST